MNRKYTHKFGLAATLGLLLAACSTTSAPATPDTLSVQALPKDAVCFYEHRDYQGRSFCTDVGSKWVGNNWNDLVSSVKVKENVKVTLFEHIDYGGRTLELTQNTALVPLKFNDLASSFKLSAVGGGDDGDDGGDDGGGGDPAAPPETIVDKIREGDPVVTRVYYDDEITVYFGEGMNPDVDWMNDYVKDVWSYMKETYGSFGSDPRIYVVAHKNPAYDYATINNRFDEGFGFRNVIDLGGAWDWENPEQINYEVITHELAHIVEGANNDTRESPSFEFWGDSKWAEIFIYDVYKNLDKDDWIQDWFDRMESSEGTAGGYGDSSSRTFRDWFYPVYKKYGGAAVYNRYFELLSQCFPTEDFEADGETVPLYTRRANPGEILHFFSGAAGEDLSAQFDEAYGLTSEVQSQFQEAQSDFSCAANY